MNIELIGEHYVEPLAKATQEITKRNDEEYSISEVEEEDDTHHVIEFNVHVEKELSQDGRY